MFNKVGEGRERKALRLSSACEGRGKGWDRGRNHHVKSGPLPCPCNRWQVAFWFMHLQPVDARPNGDEDIPNLQQILVHRPSTTHTPILDTNPHSTPQAAFAAVIHEWRSIKTRESRQTSRSTSASPLYAADEFLISEHFTGLYGSFFDLLHS